MNLLLIARALWTTLVVTRRLRSEPWQSVLQKLDKTASRSRPKLSQIERRLAFQWSRRLATRLSNENVCLICSLTLLEMDGSPLELFLGMYPGGAAHAWIQCGNEQLTTDRRLPEDASLVFKNEVSP